MIKKCTCSHEYQDAKHGEGMRVMNETAKDANGSSSWRCTVCEREHRKGEK
jgi:hypothetical protein